MHPEAAAAPTFVGNERSAIRHLGERQLSGSQRGQCSDLARAAQEVLVPRIRFI
jgi:hypothetical protein